MSGTGEVAVVSTKRIGRVDVAFEGFTEATATDLIVLRGGLDATRGSTARAAL